MILADAYTHRTYYMGMVDENNKVNFYDGKVRVMSPEGQRVGKYAPPNTATGSPSTSSRGRT